MQLHSHLLMNFYCLQYAQFIRLLERLSALPCNAAEEEFVGRFRRTVTIQSKKHLIEPLQYDEQGMAFSTGQGNTPWRGGASPSVGTWQGACVLSPFAVPFVRLFIFAAATLDFRGFKILVDILKTGTLQCPKKGCGHITYTITLAFCIFTFSTGGNSKVFITELSYIH